MRGESVTVSELMSSIPRTIRAGQTVEHALHEMHSADIRHLPVVDDDDRLVGILSDRDLLRGAGTGQPKGRLVGDVMTEDVATVRPETRACEATALMLDMKVGALPVVEVGAKVVGIITETDFLRVAHRALGGEQLATDEK